MAIARMTKFNLLTPTLYKDSLLRELQIFRNVEFHQIDIGEINEKNLFNSANKDDDLMEVEETISKCNYAIGLVSKYAPTKGGIKEMAAGLPNLTFAELEDIGEKFDLSEYYKKAKALGDELDYIEYKLIKSRETVEDLSPFSAFDITQDMLDKLEWTTDIIGGCPTKLAGAFEARMAEIELLDLIPVGVRKDEKVYLVVSYKDLPEDLDLEEEFRTLSFSRTKLDLEYTPSEKVKQLRQEQEELRARRKEVIAEIKKLAPEIEVVKEVYEYKENLKVRLVEEAKLLETEKVFMISGYIFEKELKQFEDIIQKTTEGIYALEISEAEKDSKEVPIALENNKVIKSFESLTSTYALPKYNEIDPTPLFAAVYAVFFGMMAADAAYGLVLLTVTSVALWKFNLKPAMRHMVKFFRILSISVIGWGILYGSYFGATIPGMWRWLDPGKDFMTILVMSICMGIAHIYYGLGIKAYMHFRDGKPMDAVFDVFSWYIALSGGIAYLVAYFMKLTGTVPQVGLYALLIGFVMILIGGMRSASGNIGAKLGAGLYNLYGISGYVGDFVSYSRLMALGLSGGFIAFAVNVIAKLLMGSPLGIPVAIIVLVAFHAFNLFLSYLGAYVHALRLIYVEFFGKFYEGGGRPFKIFRNKSKYINLDRQYED